MTKPQKIEGGWKEVATAYKNPTISTHSVLKLLYGKEKRL